ncbi:hypothetical protein QO239_05885 [Cupriavidus taiwanensis]|nr:hypothetical protein [Cupriavidus taiwanensis]MDK3022136.1 hypothetical protein [Cupriavidus taiwanensis]NSX14775.1 hypothetical protein [Cupriavidus taiwanensis]
MAANDNMRRDSALLEVDGASLRDGAGHGLQEQFPASPHAHRSGTRLVNASTLAAAYAAFGPAS